MYRNGAVTPLGTLGGDDDDPFTFSRATGVNARGQVVGVSNGRAFLHQDGVMRDLGTLGGNSAVANGINERGWILGTASNADDDLHAFLLIPGN